MASNWTIHSDVVGFLAQESQSLGLQSGYLHHLRGGLPFPLLSLGKHVGFTTSWHNELCSHSTNLAALPHCHPRPGKETGESMSCLRSKFISQQNLPGALYMGDFLDLCPTSNKDGLHFAGNPYINSSISQNLGEKKMGYHQTPSSNL